MVRPIIVLGTWINEDGSLTNHSRTRTDKAVELYKKQRNPVIFTGNEAFPEPYSSALGMAKHAIEEGVNPTDIILEERCRDTLAKAVLTKTRLAIPEGWNELTVVTNTFHMPRSKKMFEFVYGPDFSIDYIDVESKATKEQEEKELKTTRIFQEQMQGIKPGDHEAIIQRMLEKHTMYKDVGIEYFVLRRAP